MANQPAMLEADRDAIEQGRTALGIELGSTRIKACLVAADDPSRVLATGGHGWENRYEDENWTYSLDEVHAGLQDAYAHLVAQVRDRYGVTPTTYGSIAISAMMHGYLAFDADGELLAPFRTWRNTSTGPAADRLTKLFDVNIPLRWSIAHYHQAILDGEEHVGRVDFLTTLAGYVHRRLTGERVLGVGDASGMFPIGPLSAAGPEYDPELVRRYDAEAAGRGAGRPITDLLPRVLAAGDDAGVLSDAGAALLDPTGVLRPGIPFAPPEGDAGTGMVATNAVAPRTGNTSVGTSIFAMIVLEVPLRALHREVDLVTTPVGDPVAMVHCNNGASELAAWVGLFREFAAATSGQLEEDEVFGLLFSRALEGAPDAGGVLAYNHLAGEPVAGLTEGRPLVLRTPASDLTLANFMRAQLYGVFGSLSLGMRALDGEDVRLERMYAHGGVFRTAGVAQRFLAAALDVPVAVSTTASEGGAWGAAVLAAYRLARARAAEEAATSLADFLDQVVFGASAPTIVAPEPEDVDGYSAYLQAYRTGLAAVQAATAVV